MLHGGWGMGREGEGREGKGLGLWLGVGEDKGLEGFYSSAGWVVRRVSDEVVGGLVNGNI